MLHMLVRGYVCIRVCVGMNVCTCVTSNKQKVQGIVEYSPKILTSEEKATTSVTVHEWM